MDTVAEQIVARHQAKVNERRVWLSHWQDLAEIFHPVRADFEAERVQGEKRTEEIFDGTPLQAVRGLTAGIDWMIHPKDDKWFFIRPVDRALMQDRDAVMWLEEVERRMYGAIYAPSARFLQATGEVDTDLVVFGTGCLFYDIRPQHLIFRAVALKDITIGENEDGQIDCIYREIKLTAAQAARLWGAGKLSKEIQEALKSDNPKDRARRWTFLHAVEPREQYDARRMDRSNMPFASHYVDVAGKLVVSEGGFPEFPYVVPRWATASGEIYGRGPGMAALPDGRTLNEMSRTNLTAAHYAVEPPLLVPNDGSVSAVNMFPGALTAYDVQTAIKLGRIPVEGLNTGVQLPWAMELEDRRRLMVEAAFFKNVLHLPVNGPEMTATEVLERKQEFIRVLGPTFGRLEADYTAPIVQRVFLMMMRAGLFPPPPESLGGAPIRIEHQSPVTRAREMIEVAALSSAVAQLGPLVNLRPDMLDHLDLDAIAREVPQANGVPARWLKAVEAVEAVRQQRAEEAQAEQDAADAMAAAEVSPKAARAVQTMAELEGGGNG